MQPSYQETCDIAKKAVSIFAASGLSCCLMGSLACALYGTTRQPNDVDLVVLTRSYTQESLKEILVAADSNFYLVRSKARFATYRVLWYRLPSRPRQYNRTCKVDILIPGVLNIPDVPTDRVHSIDGLPVMPLPLLLWMKLQGWSDHRASTRMDMIMKQYDDVKDINELLQILRRLGMNIRRSSLKWVPASLISASESRIWQYVRINPDTASAWEAIGEGEERLQA